VSPRSHYGLTSTEGTLRGIKGRARRIGGREGLTIVYCCIAPHGGELIPSLAGRRDLKRFEQTRRGIRELARKVAEARPDTIVVSTPHNLRLFRRIGIVTSENSSGRLREGRREVSLSGKCDVQFARRLLRMASKAALPVVGANYGTADGPASDLPMDWGTLVPLWFFLKENRLKSRILIITPSREIPIRQNFEFGGVLADLAESEGRRFVFVASADQAHAHRRGGPYGFSPRARAYDKRVIEAIKGNRLKAILDIRPAFVEEAKPDSLWQMTMLAGILDRVKMVPKIYSYQVPTYYGMMCADFSRPSS